MKDGFTLIETLVVISIIAILSTIILAYSNANNYELALFADRAKISGALEMAKSLSLEKWKGSGSGVACAYGVYFSSSTNSYWIYGYRANDIQVCDSSSDFSYNPGGTNYDMIQTLTLNGRIRFYDLSTTSVYFEPPYLASNGGTITLSIIGQGTTSSVEISQDGNITSL